MDQRPFDAAFDRWLSRELVAEGELPPIPGLTERVLREAQHLPVALPDRQRMLRTRRWSLIANVAAALALATTLLLGAPAAWQSYQEAMNVRSELQAASPLSAAAGSNSSGINDEVLLAAGGLLAVVTGLAALDAAGSGQWSALRRIAGGIR